MRLLTRDPASGEVSKVSKSRSKSERSMSYESTAIETIRTVKPIFLLSEAIICSPFSSLHPTKLAFQVLNVRILFLLLSSARERIGQSLRLSCRRFGTCTTFCELFESSFRFLFHTDSETLLDPGLYGRWLRHRGGRDGVQLRFLALR